MKLAKTRFRLGHAREKRSLIKVFLSSLLAFFLFYRLFPATRVGDGSEYVLQYEAIVKGHKPWITNSALRAYDLVFSRHELSSLVNSSQIRTSFPALAIGNTFDLNHFWMYSALAGVMHFLCEFFLINLSVVNAFLILHASLFALVITVAWKKFKSKGIASVLLLTLSSPIFWYGNKIHTEFYTFCLVTLSTILVCSGEFGLAALSLSFASTQNPSFALIAFLLLGLQVVKHRKKNLKLKNFWVIVAALAISSFHPIYYLWRQGVLSPQLKAGGAALTNNFGSFFLWIVDPDVGLLPNWPLGLFLLAGGSLLARKSDIRRLLSKEYYIYTGIFLLISLYAQSSTTNLNSGGTPGLARYGLWYVGLFFPLAYFAVDRIISINSNWKRIVLLTSITGLAISSVYCNLPTRPEQFTTPSITSEFLQSHFSVLYSPPAPIFVGRYSGIGESTMISAVVGPDCKKMVVLADAARKKVISPGKCLYSENALQNLVSTKQTTIKTDTYFRLTNSEIKSLLYTTESGTIQFKDGSIGDQLLGAGWSGPENWGVWSDSKKSDIYLPCLVGNQHIRSIKLIFNTFGPERMSIYAEGIGRLAMEKTYNGVRQTVEISLQDRACLLNRIHLTLHFPDAVSPLSRGLSQDSRVLGIGLTEMSIG